MKIGHFAVLPAQVRYDRALTDKAILLFAEIVAATDAYGVCEEDNTHFATALQIDNRTVVRCLQQLMSAGHIQKFKEGTKRKFRIITNGFSLPDGVEIVDNEKVKYEDITPFIETIFELWDNGLRTIFHKSFKTQRQEQYEGMLRNRLTTFSKEEILSSLKNRINFMYNSEWFRENEQMAISIESIIKDDISILKWLNSKSDEPEKAKSFAKEHAKNIIK